MTVQVDPYTFANDTVADALEVNARFDLLYTLQNAAIDSTNMNMTAAYAWTGAHTFTDTDAIGVTIKQTGAFTALFINQDGNGTALSIDSESTTANCIDINADPTTTGTVVDITADGLTSGRALVITSTSTDATARNLVEIVNSGAGSTGTVPLFVQQDIAQTAFTLKQSAAATGMLIDQNGDGIALSIDSEATTANSIFVSVPTTTTGNTLNISAGTGYTTGRVAHFNSDSASHTTETVLIHQDNASSSAYALNVTQDASIIALLITQNGNSEGMRINGAATTESTLNVNGTSTTTADIFTSTAGTALTSGSAAQFYSNSGAGHTTETVKIHQDNASSGANALTVDQDATGNAIAILTGGVEKASWKEDGALSLPDIDPPAANEANRNSFVKGWGQVGVSGTATGVATGYNITGSSTASWEITVTIDTDFNDVLYAIVATPQTGASTTGNFYVEVRTMATGTFKLKAIDPTTGNALSSTWAANWIAIGTQ